jgi:hypothetical protein
MSIKATVNTTTVNRVSVKGVNKTQVKTVSISPPLMGSADKVNGVDFDLSSLANNYTIVYSSEEQKFVSKELPIVNGGTF